MGMEKESKPSHNVPQQPQPDNSGPVEASGKSDDVKTGVMVAHEGKRCQFTDTVLLSGAVRRDLGAAIKAEKK